MYSLAFSKGTPYLHAPSVYSECERISLLKGYVTKISHLIILTAPMERAFLHSLQTCRFPTAWVSSQQRMLAWTLAINLRSRTVEPKSFCPPQPIIFGNYFCEYHILRQAKGDGKSQSIQVSLSVTSRPLGCFRASEEPLLMVFMDLWGSLQQLLTNGDYDIFVGSSAS